MWRLLAVLLVFSMLLSCEDDSSTVVPQDEGYHYLPLRVGQEAIFQVDSILYDDFSGSVDTLSFQRRERIESSFLDDIEETVYRVEVDLRLNENSSWRTVEVITRQRDEQGYEAFIDNKRVILLVFPPRKGKRWDANAKNVNDKQEFTIVSTDVPYQLNDSTYFNTTLTVLQEDEENLIERFYAEEKYAAGYGLIYRKDIALETELNGTIRSGYEATIQLLSFTP